MFYNIFGLLGAEDQFSTMTHVHMTDVRVWLPGVTVHTDHIKIWMKRYGTSQVYDQQGKPWTFTHGARTMLFEYSTVDHSNISPQTSNNNYKQNTRVEINEEKSDYVALSPIGPWSFSISRRYNPGLDTTEVNAIYLQLSYSFLPCARPECPIRSLNATISDSRVGEQNLIPQTKKPSGDANDGSSSSVGTIVAVFCCISIITIGLVIVAKLIKKGCHSKYTNLDNI